MTSKSILVLGSSGFLGSRLSGDLSAAGHRVVRQVRRRVSAAEQREIVTLTQSSLVAALRELRPDAVINLVALTDVDQCERDLAAAYRSNVEVTANVAAAIAEAAPGCHLVQISTDQLYSGSGPHAEDSVAPVN